MDPIDRTKFTKERYIEAISIAECELGSILPYGQWGDTFSMPFQTMRKSVRTYFGDETKYWAAPMDTVLPLELADQFNTSIVPLTQGKVKNRDIILQYHV